MRKEQLLLNQHLVKERFLDEERLELQSQPITDLRSKTLDTIDFLTDYKRIHRFA